MIDCEKCSQSPSAVLVIDVPDYIHDKLAGWFMCQACFDQDPEGWYEVVDATQFDDGPAKRPTKRTAKKAARTGRPKPQIDERTFKRALHLYEQEGSVKKVVDVMFDDLPWGTPGSATESLRRLIREREAVAA